MNPYEILGLARGAGEAEVNAAFRRLAKSCHPDANPGDAAAEARFKRLSTARDDILSGRAAEPARRPGWSEPGAGRATPPPRQARARRRDVRREIEITLAEAFSGGTVRVTGAAGTCGLCSGDGFRMSEQRHRCATCGGSGISGYHEKGIIRVKVSCPDCGGTGHTRKIRCEGCEGYGATRNAPAELAVPPGCEDGAVFVLPGAAADPAAGLVGDLEVVVRVKPDGRFRRVGNDIEADVAVPVWDAALGGKAAVPTLDGRTLRLSVPAGCQHGRRFRLKGQGMPSAAGPGDLVAVVGIRVPDASSGPLRAAMEAARRAAST